MTSLQLLASICWKGDPLSQFSSDSPAPQAAPGLCKAEPSSAAAGKITHEAGKEGARPGNVRRREDRRSGGWRRPFLGEGMSPFGCVETEVPVGHPRTCHAARPCWALLARPVVEPEAEGQKDTEGPSCSCVGKGLEGPGRCRQRRRGRWAAGTEVGRRIRMPHPIL